MGLLIAILAYQITFSVFPNISIGNNKEYLNLPLLIFDNKVKAFKLHVLR